MKLKITILAFMLLTGTSLWAAGAYTIYPTPHQQIEQAGTVTLAGTVNVVCGKSIDQATRQRAEQVLKEQAYAANGPRPRRMARPTCCWASTATRARQTRRPRA